MTELIFSFDTEDFTSEHAAGAILELADIMTEENVRGCFCMVGLLAKQLVAWRRFDILDALKKHEIASHTYGHSLHPNVTEYADLADYRKVKELTAVSEAEGLGMIRAATGCDRIYAACPPGQSYSYAVMYELKKQGVGLYTDSQVKTADGGDIYFCNMLQSEYYEGLEYVIFEPEPDYDGFLDALAKRKRAIIYTHPNIFRYRNFWDEVNYDGENKHPFGQWEEAERRTPEEEQLYFSNFRKLLRKIKADGRFRIVTYGDIVTEREKLPARVVTRKMLPEIRANLKKEFCEMTSPLSLSLSDVFSAVTAFLCGAETHTCGDVYGFLETPHGVTSPVTVSAEALRATAKTLHTDDFLPSSLSCGQAEIGPADYLFAALDVLLGAENVTILPKEQFYPFDRYPALRDLSLRGLWLFSKDFHDTYMSDRIRQQAWTIRLG